MSRQEDLLGILEKAGNGSLVKQSGSVKTEVEADQKKEETKIKAEPKVEEAVKDTVAEAEPEKTPAPASKDEEEAPASTEASTDLKKSPYEKKEKTAELFNNLKSAEFFDPTKINGDVHVIGVGAVGGAICENLCRLGLPKITIWDMDEVESHNLGNQVFRNKDIGQPKVDAIEDIMLEINPNMEIEKHNEPVTVNTKMSGYIFLCIDNIDVRRELCTKWKLNPNILFITDGRMRLVDGNVHSADWAVRQERENLLNSMDYTHEEAKAATPVSACGFTLSVVCTPRVVSAVMVANWIKFCNTTNYSRFTDINTYESFMEGFMVKKDPEPSAAAK